MSSTPPAPHEARQLQSLVRPEGMLEVGIRTVDVPVPGPGEVLVRVEAAPINPSDLGLLFAGADAGALRAGGEAGQAVLEADLSAGAMGALAGRVGVPMPVGNEGAGTVVAAGSAPDAQALLGAIVAVAGGGMYSEYRCVPAAACLVLPEGTTAAEGASSFVNPMTAIGMVETMRLEGHTALVHTAAASNLGQMLSRLCIEEDIPLVNVVRRPEQEQLLRAAGATHVCDSSAPDFQRVLTDALRATGATIAFDATGGGNLASRILGAMEEAAPPPPGGYSRYGSTVFKQVYIYGNLDRRPTELVRTFGFSWSIGGWLLTPFLQRVGQEGTRRLRDRVAAGLTTTFASTYTDVVSLADVLRPEVVDVYARQATGRKYLIDPQR